MSAIGLSGDVAQVAITLLTANILLGLLISSRYSPVRYWPHRKINIFWIHNQTGLAALCVSVLHPALLLFSARVKFRILDVVFPAWSPQQPTVNLIGAAALYALAFVLVTSYYRVQIGRRTWKALHFTTYLVAGCAFVHGILANPHLNSKPVNYLDGGKIYIEICLLIVLAAFTLRVRFGRAKARRSRIADASIPEATV